MHNKISASVCLALLLLTAVPAKALNPALPPGGNFALSHWYLQLPTAGGVLTGTGGSVDSASAAQLVAGFTNDYFYTGPDGAMTFWVPDNGATTSGSTHPRSELREQLIPGNNNTNWTLYGTHVLTATCVVSNVPADTGKVCIGQMHEPNTRPDGSVSAGNEHMIMFDLPSKKIYANVNLDGNLASSFSTTFISGSSVALGKPITYTMSVVDGVLQIVINNVTNAWDLFSGTNYSGHVARNWDAASGNTLYFKAGDYNQTANTCGCSNDGARVAFYSLNRYHAPNLTNQPASQTADAGSNVIFSVAASGNGTLSYQWWFNATNLLAGATNAALMISKLAAPNAGNYAVVVSDRTSSFNAVTSAVATLTVLQPGTTSTFANPGLATWVCPTGVTSIQIECWGGGGAGGSALRNPNSSTVQYGGGGAGGAYARVNAFPVTPGNTYYLNVGAGGLAATGTLTNDGKVPGGDSWFNPTNLPPVGAGSCLGRGGDGGQCAVGNTTATAFGAGGLGTTSGSLGDVLFAGGSGGTPGTSTGYGGSGGGSGGFALDGISGGTNGLAAVAVNGGGPGGAPNVTGGSSGPGQTPVSGPGGGGGGARATAQQTGGNGANGQVILTLLYFSPATITSVLVTNQNFQIQFAGTPLGSYTLVAKTNLTDPVWRTIATNLTDSSGFGIFSDSSPTSLPRRFYRLQSP